MGKKKSKIKKATEAIEAMGYDVETLSKKEIQFTSIYGTVIKYFPMKSWATGKHITDGRGLEHLLNQI